MAFLDDIAARIGGLSALSTYTIVRGTRPDTPDKVVALYETGGQAPDLGFGTAGLQFEYPGLQVVVRGAADDYVGPRDAIEAIYQDLPKVQAVTLSGTLYHLIRPSQAPFLLERDGKRRVVHVVNFIAERKTT